MATTTTTYYRTGQIPFTGTRGTPSFVAPGTQSPGGGGGMVNPVYSDWVRSNYSPLTQSGMETAGRYAARAYIPGMSFAMDAPQQGPSQETGQKILGSTPYVGPLFNAISAGRTAEGRQGWMTQNRQPSFWENLMQTVGAGLRFAPSGPGTDIAKNIYSGIRGVQGIPEFMGTSWGNLLSGAGGLATRGLLDRTGVIRGGGVSPWSPTADVLRDRGDVGGGPTYSPGSNAWALNPSQNPMGFNYGAPVASSSPSANPFANPDTGAVPSWAGGPSTWNQPSWTWNQTVPSYEGID